MAITFTRLTDTFAAVVHGVDIATGVSDEDFATIAWQPKDLVMWDNRCCLHRGCVWDKAHYRRVMHRTTVAGDGPTAHA